MQKVTRINKTTEPVPYFSGLPTDIELRKLNEAYPKEKLTPDLVLYYDSIGELIGSKYQSHRFNTVLQRWRNHLIKEYGIHVGPFVRGESMKVYDDTEKNEKAMDLAKGSQRKLRKAVRAAMDTNPKNLTDDQKHSREFMLAKAAKIQAISQIKSRQKLLPAM